MSTVIFRNKKGENTSLRSRVGNIHVTNSLKPGEIGKYKGVTFKGSGMTTRFGSNGRLIGVGNKFGKSTYYTNSLGKKRSSLTPY